MYGLLGDGSGVTTGSFSGGLQGFTGPTLGTKVELSKTEKLTSPLLRYG